MIRYLNACSAEAKRFLSFSRLVIRGIRSDIFRDPTLLNQLFAVGVRSLPVTLLAGLFVGAIMAVQIQIQLKNYGAEIFLGGLSTSVTLRHVGPVLIAFLLAAKVGAYTSAELGLMRVTEQVDALRCLGVDPIRFLVAPRFFAVVLASFALLVVGLVITILGGIAIMSFRYQVSPELYLSQVPRMVTGSSLFQGLLKSLVFGAIIGMMSCYQGYHSGRGVYGVGESVRKTAVLSLVWIIVADYILAVMGSGLGRLEALF